MQDKEIKRVSDNIANVVLAWVSSRYESGERTFNCRDLENAICDTTRCTPGSPSRILRLLKADGYVEYDVVSRSESKYRIVYVNKNPRIDQAIQLRLKLV